MRMSGMSLRARQDNVSACNAKGGGYLHARHYESTDDAFIDARPVIVSPQVTGDLISVNVTDDQILKT